MAITFYLVGTIGADGLFYLDTTQWWTTELPTTDDGKLYIRIGKVLTDGGYTASLWIERPVFYNDGTGIREYGLVNQLSEISGYDKTETQVPSERKADYESYVLVFLWLVKQSAFKASLLTAQRVAPANTIFGFQCAVQNDGLRFVSHLNGHYSNSSILFCQYIYIKNTFHFRTVCGILLLEQI